MKKFHFFILICLISCFIGCSSSRSQTNIYFQTPDVPLKETKNLPMIEPIKDPLEPFNRASFAFTDYSTRYVFQPFIRAYAFILPKPVRKSIHNFYENIRFPIRLFSNSLQGKWHNTLEETERFLINSTVGIAGLFDPALHWGFQPHPEDFGQTFGWWGMQPGFYFFIPFLGPSSGRDALGEVFNTAANPLTYVPSIIPNIPLGLLIYLRTISPTFTFNELSLRIDEYIQLVESQGDPYLFIRDYWAVIRMKEVADFKVSNNQGDGKSIKALGALALRNTPEFFKKRKERKVNLPTTQKKFPFSIWLQKKPAPLVYLLPGIGSNRHGSRALFLAEVLYRSGYHVAVVSNVFNWEFIRYGSKTSIPGYLPQDIEDLKTVLTQINHYISDKWSDLIQNKILMGYSLGGQHALLLASHLGASQNNLSLSFDRYIVLGGPLDLEYALERLDEFYNAPLKWPEDERLEKIRFALLKTAGLLDPEAKNLKQLPFTKTESQYLLGLSNRVTLRSTLLALHKFREFKDPLGKISWYNHENFYTEAGILSFKDYQDEYLKPMAEKQDKDFESKTSVISQKDFYKNQDNIRVIINEDDSLLRPKDIQWLRETFGEHLTVFPVGGHMGNLYQEEVIQEILKAVHFPNEKTQ